MRAMADFDRTFYGMHSTDVGSTVGRSVGSSVGACVEADGMSVGAGVFLATFTGLTVTI